MQPDLAMRGGNGHSFFYCASYPHLISARAHHPWMHSLFSPSSGFRLYLFDHHSPPRQQLNQTEASIISPSFFSGATWSSSYSCDDMLRSNERVEGVDDNIGSKRAGPCPSWAAVRGPYR